MMATAATRTATASPINRPPRNVRMICLSQIINKSAGTEEESRPRWLQFRLLLHDHLGAHGYAVIEVGDVGIDQAEAAGGDLGADRIGAVGAVDTIDGGAEIHGARPERVARAAGHEARQIGLAGDHLGWRRPVRPLRLLGDVQKPLPLKAVAADADAVA